MAVKIRLARFGTKKKPLYRVVVATDSRSRDGHFIERVGWYDPQAEAGGLKMNMERIQYWLGHGAIPTNKVRTLIQVAVKETPVTAEPTPKASADSVANNA